MKNIIVIISCLALISCKAQQIFPLNTSTTKAPANSYFKDLNNELDQYAGTWTASYQEKNIKLVVIKELKTPIKLLSKDYFTDRLVVRYEIRNSNGTILQSTLNKDFIEDRKLNIRGLATKENGNVAWLIFSGGNCNIGNGFIYFEKINATQFKWKYTPSSVTMNDIDCPPNLDYTIYLPETENLIFTKQKIKHTPHYKTCEEFFWHLALKNIIL